ncbi:hypothetical protein AY599_18230 [Leptolyngbya valderiana BDU 20041]|nr:hypothetical protein AY599_18230 [Leptolyngbya valderiana BDU 20041]
MSENALSIWTLLVAIAGVLVPTFLALAGAWLAIHRRIGSIERDAMLEVNRLRIECYQEFIQQKSLDEMERRLIQSEERMIGAINNLTGRIDRMANRIDQALTDFSKRHGAD